MTYLVSMFCFIIICSCISKNSKSKLFWFGNSNTSFTHRKIVDRIDTDKDGYVSHAELHYWIKHRQRRYIEENVNKNWKDYDMNQDDKIGWEEYKNTTYGYYLGKSLVNKLCVHMSCIKKPSSAHSL